MGEPPRAIARYPDEPRRLNAERRRGLVLLAIAVPALVGWAIVLMLLREHEIVTHRKVFRALGIPLALGAIVALAGLAKVAFGKSVGELARAWDDLSGGQRFVAGVLAIAVAFVVILTLVSVALTIMMG